jgi:hypothetical protein
VSERIEHDAAVRDELGELTAVPDMPEVPAVAGAFVEIRPGTWLRASSVVAVTNGYRVDPRDPTRSHIYAVDTAGPIPGGATFRSPFTAALLLIAFRQAEYAEDLRRLEVLAQLLAACADRAR